MNSRVCFLALLALITLPILREAAQDDAPGEMADVPWYLNNVVSTSLETPAAALRTSLEETVEVRGTIIDVDGSPAAGAEVWAASLFASPPARERVFTDAQGRFVLRLTLRDQRQELLEQQFTVAPGDHLKLLFVIDTATGEAKLAEEEEYRRGTAS